MADSSKHTILLLASSPDDEDRLALDAERSAIDRELRSSAQRDEFEIRIAEQVEAEQLPGLIMRYNPVILQFSGHGTEEGLLFQRRDGASQPTKVDAVANVFRLLGGGIRCVLLNACYSAPQAERIAEHVDVVVGMRQGLDDRSAIAFSAGFYEALGYGKSFAEAFELGKSRIELADLPGEDQPKLHFRASCDPATLRLPALGRRDEPVRRAWWVPGAMVALSVVAVVGIWKIAKVPESEPVPMPDESKVQAEAGGTTPEVLPAKVESSKVEPEPVKPDIEANITTKNTKPSEPKPEPEPEPEPKLEPKPPKRWKVDRIEDVSTGDQKRIVLAEADDLPSTGVLVLSTDHDVTCLIKRDHPRWCSLITKPGARRPKPDDEFEIRP